MCGASRSVLEHILLLNPRLRPSIREAQSGLPDYEYSFAVRSRMGCPAGLICRSDAKQNPPVSLAAANGKLMPLPFRRIYAKLSSVIDIIEGDCVVWAGVVIAEARLYADDSHAGSARSIGEKWSSACGRSNGGKGPFWRHSAN